MTVNVLALQGDFSGCGRYRIEDPARAVNASDLGFHVTVASEIPCYLNKKGEPEELNLPQHYDIVIIQRPLNAQLCATIPLFQKINTRVIVELDDHFSALDPTHVGWELVHPKYSPFSNYQHLKKATQIADWVTVSTPALAKEYGAHGRVSVVRNYVPRALTEIKAEKLYDVGWSGTTSTHPNDLYVVSGALRDTNFRAIGDGEGLQAALYLQNPPSVSGWQDIDSYYKSLAELRVGIAPLEISRFNTAKSWLKPLEYAAVGAVPVCSPTDEYKLFVEQYGGEIATRSGEWRKKVHTLINDPDYVVEYGSKLQQEVINNLLIENHAADWTEAWSNVL